MTNDVILIDSLLEQNRIKNASYMSESDYFNLFTAEQIVKDYDLSYEDLIDGIVDGSGDGAIDSIYTFINGELLTDDYSLKNINKNPVVDLFLIQNKNNQHFKENQISILIASIKDLFNLSKDKQLLTKQYNSQLTRKIIMFRDAFIALSSKHPSLNIFFNYASKGSTNNIHPNVHSQAEKLKEEFNILFPGSTKIVKFFGARELLDLSRIEKKYTLQLNFTETYISLENNYVILTKLFDYFKFIKDERGELRKYIFEFNVRDYEGNVEVNNDISNSLYNDKSIDFWNLNNGITIICSKASIVGKTISMDDVQIVNGLQTTHTLYDYFNTLYAENDDYRSILIKIIVTTDPRVIDKIIKATNFQTMLRDASFKATDNIQRDIEMFFLQNNWYYERRKNYYKNSNKPSDRIVNIAFLAQAILAVLLKEPNNSRGRPTTLIKKKEDYNKIFNKNISFEIMLYCAKLIKEIEKFVRSKTLGLKWQDMSNLRFHIAYQFVLNKLGDGYKVNDLNNVKDLEITLQDLATATVDVWGKVESYKEDENNESVDVIAKSKRFMRYF